jgi:hypothetical protein
MSFNNKMGAILEVDVHINFSIVDEIKRIYSQVYFSLTKIGFKFIKSLKIFTRFIRK